MPSPVVLLHDAHASRGRVDASDVLREAEHLVGALATLGYAGRILPVGLDLAELERTLESLEPYVVVNLVESISGRGELIHVVPALLEAANVPFTGCSAGAQYLTSNKLAAKRHMRRCGIPTPAPFLANGGERGPWIVKSVWEHASLGLDDASVVADEADVRALIESRRGEFGGRWFAETYVPGRELNVAIIAAPGGPRVLPVAEIVFRDFPPDKPQIVGYAAKWYGDTFECRNTVREFVRDASLAARAVDLALACWEAFELDGYARVDLRIAADGEPWVLEVNANPCLSPDAGFAAALNEAGIGLETAVAWLLDDALRRVAGTSRRG
jgi:D-alanine-D-alanine ligase